MPSPCLCGSPKYQRILLKNKAERQAAQHFIDNGSLSAGSRSCFFRTDDYDLLATDIQEKMPKEVKKYYLIFKRSVTNWPVRLVHTFG
jgi:hypothetical protein